MSTPEIELDSEKNLNIRVSLSLYQKFHSFCEDIEAKTNAEALEVLLDYRDQTEVEVNPEPPTITVTNRTRRHRPTQSPTQKQTQKLGIGPLTGRKWKKVLWEGRFEWFLAP